MVGRDMVVNSTAAFVDWPMIEALAADATLNHGTASRASRSGRSRGQLTGLIGEAIDELYSACHTPRHPGLAIAIVDRGAVVFQRAYGLACIEQEAPLGVHSLLHLGSTTKHFCAACLLILEDRQALSLDDSVRQYVPELPAFADAISLRRLLNMTSGLPDGLNWA